MRQSTQGLPLAPLSRMGQTLPGGLCWRVPQAAEEGQRRGQAGGLSQQQQRRQYAWQGPAESQGVISKMVSVLHLRF